MTVNRLATLLMGLVAAALVTVTPVAQSGTGGRGSIGERDLQQWLSYIASDELEGRATFSEGLALASAYIADHLREWGVTPGGDNGTYFQRVPVLGVKSENRSTVTVQSCVPA